MDEVGNLIQFLDQLDPSRLWHSMWDYEKLGSCHRPIWWCSLNLHSVNKTKYYVPDKTKRDARIKLAKFIIGDLKTSTYEDHQQTEYRCFKDMMGKVRVLARDSSGRISEGFGRTIQEGKMYLNMESH